METSYGQLMDEFIATYIPEGNKQLAMLQLQYLVLRAQRSAMAEMKNAISPDAA